MSVCPYCNGRGYCYVESGSSLSYCCPDCNGSGYLPECDVCGKTYEGEYCEDCYAECEECGEVCLIDDMINGLCEECYEELNNETPQIVSE